MSVMSRLEIAGARFQAWESGVDCDLDPWVSYRRRAAPGHEPGDDEQEGVLSSG